MELLSKNFIIPINSSKTEKAPDEWDEVFQ